MTRSPDDRILRRPTTARALVNLLGGQKKVSQRLSERGRSRASLYHWMISGKIPAAHYMALRQLAAEVADDIEVSPDLFSFTELCGPRSPSSGAALSQVA